MLSQDAIDRINDEIEDAVREAGRFGVSHEKQMQALERASKLKSILDPNPTPQEVVEMLAAALKGTPTITVQHTAPMSLADAWATLLSRR